MLIIFLFDNFFETVMGAQLTIFRKKRRPAQNINITFFYHKLGTKYFTI